MVQGKLSGRGFIEDSVDGKAALTEWVAEQASVSPQGPVTLLCLFPHTGAAPGPSSPRLLHPFHPLSGGPLDCPLTFVPPNWRTI